MCMTRTITTRLDDTSQTYLEHLMAAGARTQSDVVRDALAIAERDRLHTLMREESVRLMADPAYQAEVTAISEQLDEISAW